MTDEALNQIAEANPVPAASREWIAKELELDRLRPGFGPRSRTPWLAAALAAVVAVAVLVVAPALGHGIPGLGFLSADKAPPPVVKSFADLGVGAPLGMDPRVISGETRKVTTIRFASGKLHTLWVAPTKAGGLCYEWTDADGGCDAHGTVPLSASWMRSASGPAPPEGASNFQMVDGFAHSKWVDEVQIHLSDGTTVDPKVVWVSAPISAGFFHYEAPAGASIESVIALNRGEAVAADNIGTGKAEPAISPFADLSKKQRAASVQTPAGQATIWTAPTKAGEVCSWLDFAGKQSRAEPCLPTSYAYQGLGVGAEKADGIQVVWAAGSPDYAAQLVFRWDDGVTDVVEPQNKFFLHAAPTGRTGVVLARRPNGELLPRFRLDLPLPTR